MTFDELLAEAEARRMWRKRPERVEFIPRHIPRRVRLESVCSCWMCTAVHQSGSLFTDASRETEAVDG